MKVIVIGTRGIPNISGGVETHCEELYPRLVKLGCDVTVIARSCYVKGATDFNYKGVKVKTIYSPKSKKFEAIIHTTLAVIYSFVKKPDLIHIHAIGPALLIPLAKIMGLKVVFTHHGPDYDRAKWGKVAKLLLKLGEFLAIKYADKVIVISNVINNLLDKKYSYKKSFLVYNGVNLPVKDPNTNFLEKYGLIKNEYIIAVGRFVKEKGFHDLIKAYSKINTNYKLVLVGDADHEDSYSIKLKAEAKKLGVILTGYIKGPELNQIYSNAYMFILPSYHEGLPIALLEAMSYNLEILISNIPANLEVSLDKDDYFEVGNVDDLKIKLENKLKNKQIRDFTSLLKEKYSWDNIANQIYEIYKK